MNKEFIIDIHTNTGKMHIFFNHLGKLYLQILKYIFIQMNHVPGTRFELVT